MAILSARMSGITQSEGLFGFNIQMLPNGDSETVLAEIEVPPAFASEHEARNKAQTALMCYELTGKFPNFSDWHPQRPSLISRVRELRDLAKCSLKEAVSALSQANEPRFAGDVLMALAAIKDETGAHDRSVQWRIENPALDRAFPVPNF
ncbi:hypothetical protein [Microvirga calopogonii]|uniref:hypothetical protein n=1 Tax=Microvirga calopogonii TaxID=2078013 RepID=UPI000E0DD4E6|nr:hypothetical protein [Microvirga calopogonii]